MCTAMPPSFLAHTFRIPRCASRRAPRGPAKRTPSRVIAQAQRTARAGPSNGSQETVAGRVDLAAAKQPQLAPRSPRMMWLSSKSFPAVIAEDGPPRSDEPTMSVNSTVASTRSVGQGQCRDAGEELFDFLDHGFRRRPDHGDMVRTRQFDPAWRPECVRGHVRG